MISLNKLQKFNHGSQGIAYNTTGLTTEQYNNIYLQACNVYNKVEQNINILLFKDEVQGYILCS